MGKKRILIIGTGSIAERHLKNIISINSSLNVSVYSDNYISNNFYVKRVQNNLK